MDDVSRQTLLRDRLRRKLAAAQTPRQRLEEMARLQEATWRMLRANPSGYARFLRRNYKARAIQVRGDDG
jgi:hypothetical protein